MRVATANLWNLNPKQLNAIRQCLDHDADVVVLPELHNKYLPDATELLREVGYDLLHVYVNRTISLGVASRIPLSQSDVLNQAPFNHRPQLKLLLENGITIFGIHLDAPVSPHRCHKRRQQLSALAKLVNQSQTPVVLAGDFNTYFSETIFQEFLTQINHQDCYESVQRPLTWPVIFPLFQIDHVLCSQSLKVTQLQSGVFNGSDHLPVYGCINWR